MSRCGQVREWLARSEADTPPWVGQHLGAGGEGCPDCQRVAARYALAVAALRDAPAPSLPPLPRPRPPVAPPWWRLPWIPWALAASAAAAAVLVWSPWGPSGTGPAIPSTVTAGPSAATSEARSEATVEGGAGERPDDVPPAIVAGAALDTGGSAMEVGERGTARLVLAPHSELRVEAWQPDRAVLVLAAGSLTSEVAPRAPGHPFEVHTAEAVVRVVGTRFTVSRDARGTRVDTHEGVVRVETPVGRLVAVLRAGESRLVPAETSREAAAPRGAEAEVSVAARRVHVPAVPRSADVAASRPERGPSLDAAPRAEAPGPERGPSALTAPRAEAPGPERSPSAGAARAVARPPERAQAEGAPDEPEAPDPGEAPEGVLASARALLARGRDAEAVALLEGASRTRGPHQGRLLALLGDALRVRGSHEEARRAYAAALASPAPPPGALADLASLLERELDLPGEAARAWEGYLGSQPTGRLAAHARWELARLDPASAEGHLRALLEQHPDAPEANRALVALGRLLLDAGRWGEAEALFGATVDDLRPPRAEVALVGLMRVRLAQGRADAVRALAADHAARFPRGSRVAEVRRLLEAVDSGGQ